MSKRNSIILVVLVYILALIISIFFIKASPENDILVKAAAADVLATVIVFIASVLLSNSSMYDPYWSVAPFPIAVYWLYAGLSPDLTIRKALVIFLILFWGIRLTLNWARGWSGLAHEDWRYRMLSEKTGNAYWAVSFLGIHLFPTVIVFLGLLPVYVVMQNDGGIGVLDVLAFAIGVGAILIELVSDNQLRKFVRRKDREKGELLQTGLWAYSRHPNYFGEISFWGSLYLFALATSFDYWWTGIGFVAMILLFVFISIPMMEKRQLDSKPHFEAYKKNVSSLIPWKSRTKLQE
jgi:steroid 5-alpha reductase family enzyme